MVRSNGPTRCASPPENVGLKAYSFAHVAEVVRGPLQTASDPVPFRYSSSLRPTCTCLTLRRAAAAAPRAQTSEPRAGFRMGQSTYRTDAVAEAQAASRDEVVVTAVLLAAFHASKPDCQSLVCARGPRSGGTNDLSHSSAPLASPGTLGTAPGGPPGPRRSLDGPDEGAVPPCGLRPH